MSNCIGTNNWANCNGSEKIRKHFVNVAPSKVKLLAHDL